MRYLSCVLTACLLCSGTVMADPLGSAFTYQGQLADNGSPANGSYDFQFALYTSASGGSALDTVELDGQAVSAGLVTASLDFTDAPYNGQALWVEVSVRASGGGGFTTLAPRQPLSATPYALYALNAPAGGSLTLPFAGSVASADPAFAVANTGTGIGVSVQGAGTGFDGATLQASNGSNGGVALYAYANTSSAGAGQPVSTAVITNDSPSGGDIVEGWNQGGVRFHVDTAGNLSATGTVAGSSTGSFGVFGSSVASDGVHGETHGTGFSGVAGIDLGSAGYGVYGLTDGGTGVAGISNTGVGVTAVGAGTGLAAPALNVAANAANGIAILANATTSDAVAVFANGNGAGTIIKGFGPGGATRFQVSADGEVYAHGAFHPNGVDYSDRLPAARGLEAGDVVAIGDDGLLHRSMHAGETDVAGVYSTRPGVVGRQEEEQRLTIPVALAGRIPVKATNENGAIRAGDLLIASSTPGRAMRAAANPAAGSVIGKAMQALDGASGEIEMLVMLR